MKVAVILCFVSLMIYAVEGESEAGKDIFHYGIHNYIVYKVQLD